MNRETITEALFARLSIIPGLVSTSRKVRPFVDLAPEEMPALFVGVGRSTSQQERNRRPVWTLTWTVYIYVLDQSPTGPSPALNALLGQVEQALVATDAETATPTEGFQAAQGGSTTLGGLVSHVSLADVETDEGSLGDLGVAILTISAVTLG